MKLSSGSDSLDDGVSGNVIGKTSCFQPSFNLITWPKEKEFDQKHLNLFVFKRLDDLIVVNNKSLKDDELLKLRFTGYRDLKLGYPQIIDKVSLKNLLN